MSTTPLRRPHAAPALLAVLAIILGACSPNESPAAPTPAPTVAEARTLAPSATPRATEQPLAANPVETPAPTATRSAEAPAPSTAPATPKPPKREAFAMNLARRADFVAQYTFEWCVGASLQMALNMSTDDERTSRTDQQRLWEMARDRSSSPFGGANPIGWVATLNELGIGPYRLVSLPSFDEAVATAAAAIRETRQPVGLVMWRGRHAWMMSGFEATADPRHFDDFDVKRVRVHDPLYPHGSSVWGKSPQPNSAISLDTLAKQYVIRDRGRVNLGVPPGWLLVLPVKT
jgi:pyruvate/2-oxoglutarate dehydrogenase complex dihydrolipoamide acyltransferase (E2) component